jgi:hypothetical protein
MPTRITPGAEPARAKQPVKTGGAAATRGKQPLEKPAGKIKAAVAIPLVIVIALMVFVAMILTHQRARQADLQSALDALVQSTQSAHPGDQVSGSMGVSSDVRLTIKLGSLQSQAESKALAKSIGFNMSVALPHGTDYGVTVNAKSGETVADDSGHVN